jgi:type IV secretion system protein VirB11
MSAASTKIVPDTEIKGSELFLARALEPIRDLLDDPRIVEISVNRPGHVYVERLGDDVMAHFERPAITAAEIVNLGQRVAAKTSQFLNAAHPLLSAALPSGERIQIAIAPAAPEGGAFSIRKQVVNNLSLEEYRDSGALDKVAISLGGLSETDKKLIACLREERIYDFLKTAILERVSVLISGGTSTGKTTFLNACLKSVDLNERIITLEDTRELFPPQPNHLALLASKGGQGTADVSIGQLLEASLRMRPDRLFVGEIRGSEAFAFLRAINTGHPGSMTTVHADTPDGAYEQLAMMMQQSGMSGGYQKADLMSYIKMVIPIVVQLRREGGKRGISEIAFAKGRL